MNKCLFIGALCKDNELKESNGKVYLNNTLAVPRKGYGNSDFFSITAFGKTAELINQYFSKGSRIGLECHANSTTYEKDGHKVYATSFIVDSIDFCESKKAQDQGEKFE